MVGGGARPLDRGWMGLELWSQWVIFWGNFSTRCFVHINTFMQIFLLIACGNSWSIGVSCTDRRTCMCASLARAWLFQQIYVCMYVCMHAWIYVCVYIYISMHRAFAKTTCTHLCLSSSAAFISNQRCSPQPLPMVVCCDCWRHGVFRWIWGRVAWTLDLYMSDYRVKTMPTIFVWEWKHPSQKSS